MNNEFKYGIQGLLMAIGFFVLLNTTRFIISISPSAKEEIKSENNIVLIDSKKSNAGKGKTLFSQNCASCHALNRILTGPALAGIEDRVPDRKLLYEWIRNSDKVIQSGNPYFVKLYKDFNKIPMNQFSSFTNEDIDAILDYIGN